MPFLLGSLLTTALFIVLVADRRGLVVWFPKPVRKGFVAAIGTMIGASFSGDFLSFLPTYWVSLLAMIPFVLMAHGIGYVLQRRIGGYDRATAFYGALPGGLIEAVAIGEQAGGDVKVLSIQHFARIVLVVMIVPLLFYVWSGQTVGSAAGQAMAAGGTGVADVALVAIIALAGMQIGFWLRLPAGHMIGPMLLSAGLHATGLVSINAPVWLLGLSQLVIGVGLGTNFHGTTGRIVLRAFGLSLLTVSVILVLSLLFAAGLSRLVPMAPAALFLSFAPGGVTEMGLIALSLNLSPMIVSLHHLFRISLAVVVAGIAARRR